ncbi:MAG: helix-turn-helix domain-containing protein [Christensenellaceae bacterium]
MDEKDIIAKNIIRYRKSKGWSQLELAEKLQYSNKNISKWERGETVPSVFTLKRLSDIFEISLDELVTPYDETAADEKTAASAETVNKETKPAKKPKAGFKFKLLFLFLAIAILYAVVFIAVSVLGFLGVKSFNYWLIFLYATPLVATATMIFIRCTLKRIDYISLSLIGWLIVVSVYLTFKTYDKIGYVFLLGLAYQFVVLFIGLLVDYKYIQKARAARRLKKQQKQLKLQQLNTPESLNSATPPDSTTKD